MLGKTHLAVGVAAAMAFLQPHSVPELLIGTGAAAIGGVISDIDVGSSKSNKDANKIIAISILAVAVLVVVESVFHLGIWDLLQRKTNLFRIVLSVVLFLAICIFGKQQPHRSFMHSFLAMAALSSLVVVFLPVAAPYFAIAFAAHLAIDLFNFKKVQLFYPAKGGICFKMFHATGVANTFFCLIGGFLAIAEIGYRLWIILRG